MSRTWKTLFALSGLLGLLASISSPVLAAYPVFVLAYLRGWRLPKIGSPFVQLMISTVLSTTLLLEGGAWLDNYLKNEPDPALFHPQLIPDLIMGIGFYAAWWLAWWLILRRYRFTVREVFITTGLYGVLIEQQGKIFLAGLSAFPVGILLWAFVFVAYGSTMALAFTLVRDHFTATRHHWSKYLLAWSGLLILSLVTSLIWGLILSILHFDPPKRLPMRDYPFW